MARQLQARFNVLCPDSEDAVFCSVVQGMIDAGVERLAKRGITVFQLPHHHSWAAQIAIQPGWFRWRANTVVKVFTLDMYGIKLSSSRTFASGFSIDTCHVVGSIRQVSGTCYFNSAVNQLCLGRRCGSLLLQGMDTIYRGLQPHEKHTFLHIPLDACKKEWDGLDVLRVFHAILCSQAPTKWMRQGLFGVDVNNAHNISSKIVHASSFREPSESAEAGHSEEVIYYFLVTMQITCAYAKNKSAGWPVMCQAFDQRFGRTADVLIVGLPMHTMPTVIFEDEEYDLDSCSISCATTKHEQAHSLSGVFCADKAGTVDSNLGFFHVFDWISAGPQALLAHVNLTYRQAGKHVEFCSCRIRYLLYVRRLATGASCATFTD